MLTDQNRSLPIMVIFCLRWNVFVPCGNGSGSSKQNKQVKMQGNQRKGDNCYEDEEDYESEQMNEMEDCLRESGPLRARTFTGSVNI